MTLARALFALGWLIPSAAAQTPPPHGPTDADLRFHALVGGAVVQKPGVRIERATLTIRDGRVVSCVQDGAPPDGAEVIDCTGLVLYPGLVEPYLAVDAPAPDADSALAHWHPGVLAQRSALDGDGATAKDREELRKLGFCAAAVAPTGGVFKGRAAVVLLNEAEPPRRATVVREDVAHVCSLAVRWGGHPSSEMGAIALVRQTLADADWFARCAATLGQAPSAPGAQPAANAALQALGALKDRPLLFDCEDELQILRAAKIAAEAGRPLLALGSGMEFRRMEAIAAAGAAVLAPLQFPEAPDVSSLGKRERTSLRQLQSWEQAPTNLARLLRAGTTTALTTHRLQDKKDFRDNLAAAIECGVDRDAALACLTTVPARLLGVDDQLGTLEPGRIANVTLVEGDLFDKKARIDSVFVAGVRHEIEKPKDKTLDGRWAVTDPTRPDAALTLVLDGGAVKAEIGGRKPKVRGAEVGKGRVEFVIEDELLGDGPCWIRLRAAGDGLIGSLHQGAASRALSAARAAADVDAGAAEEKPAEELGEPAPEAAAPLDALPSPLGGYGVASQPQPEEVVFTGAMLWTCGPSGNVPMGALWIRGGRIVYAGPVEGLPAEAKDVRRVDCLGKHITPGLIDCHSHTGISRGVNEGGEAVTAEVRVQDVIDPDDPNWYRQLAGGVTAVSQLHGSANAIGGQSSTVKVRWGARHPDEMRFEGAPAGIKFALGENPRGANGNNGGRYPNTRMGVEALIRDRFLCARDYAARMSAYEALRPKERAATLPPRRDLELEAIAEILQGRRRVHCHSYRQDEIFMLCQMAKEFGFRIGTFQHVLEGYKVAEAIREAAVGASAFSDWWGYKFEVYDAIPDNGAILHEQGVCVSFNSDSDEHARRLNTEAGKAVKYGGVAPIEALKFVTLNPAVQLGIAEQTGSLVAGKHADLAIWSEEPLSYRAVCESTWVDGAERFSIERDRALRDRVRQERDRLIRKALAAGGAKGRFAKDDERDAYWRAEDMTADYCCRDCEGGSR